MLDRLWKSGGAITADLSASLRDDKKGGVLREDKKGMPGNDNGKESGPGRDAIGDVVAGGTADLSAALRDDKKGGAARCRTGGAAR